MNIREKSQVVVSEAADALLQCSADCVKILDPAGNALYFNDNGLCVMEIDQFSMVEGKYWPDLWPPENRHLAENALANARDTGSGSFRGECPTAKGTPKWWDVLVVLVPTQIAPSGGFLVTSRDITREHELEVVQQKLDARLRDIIGSTSDVLWDIDLATDKVWWSEGLYSLFGYEPQQVGDSTKWCHEHIHPDDRQRIVNGMMDAVQAGDVMWQGEFRYRKADGSYAHVLDRGSILRDSGGKPLRFVGIMQDVSVRKACESRRELLVREQAHRINNVLAVVNGIIHQTSAKATDVERFAEAISSRILAMANANRAIVQSKWARADLAELARMQLKPYLDGQSISIDGPTVVLNIEVAQPLALAFNELATNATKYGALSVAGGMVELRWKIERRSQADSLIVSWIEREGPSVQPPTRAGLGSKLIDRGIPGAKVERRFEPEGFSCVIVLPLTEANLTEPPYGLPGSACA